jgi:serralysin
MQTLTYTAGKDQVWIPQLADSYTMDFLGGDDELTIGWADGGYGDPSIYNVDAHMGAGNDSIFLGEGTCTVYGETGDDDFTLVDTGGLRATLYGGDGADTFEIVGVTDLVANGDAGDDRFSFADGGVYPSGAHNALLHGGVGNDVFSGGNKDITGSIFGDAGNDTFVGFGSTAGGPQLHGGLGNDIYRYQLGSSAQFIEAANQGTDLVQVARGVSCTLSANIENMSVLDMAGSTAAAATLNGNGVNNVIRAGDNADTVFGFAGNDQLVGSGGNDALHGGIGNDWLKGGSGRDDVYGGSGADKYVFNDGDFGGLAVSTADRIHDFSHAQADRIQLSLVDANSAIDGDQAFAFLGNGAFTGSAGQLRYQQIDGNTYVQGDVDGDGAADFWIRVDGLHSLVSGDFIL